MADVALRPLRGLVDLHRRGIVDAATRHKGRRVAIFGSVARGDEHPESDVDFLVEFEPGSSLFDLVRLQEELSVLLNRSVDVVSLGGLLPGDDDIRSEAIWI
jgi:predicted nucleotidyltransferase